MSFMPLLTIAMAQVPARDAGLASGIVNTSLQVSAAIGVAVLGTVSTDHTRTVRARGVGLDHALLAGYQLAFRIGAGCVVVALLAALVFVRSPRRAEEVAEPVAEPLGAETAS
jgi:hypothetical protein